MIYVETNTEQGAENLAFEEYFLTREDITEPIVMLWRNRPAIVVGAFQNTFEEINGPFVKAQNIDVLRRSSGGGAVYHDLGNLCFTFIRTQVDFINTDYSEFLMPVVKVLQKMGVPAQISGRNDLLLEGAKISGSATRIYKNRILFHGTLLYKSDLSALSQALCVKQDKLRSKSIKSVRARVTRICDHLAHAPDTPEFKQNLKNAFWEDQAMREYSPTAAELEKIKLLAQEKYRNDDWTYGKSFPANMVNHRRFAGGEVSVKLSLTKSMISEIHFEGDFLGCMELTEAERALIGVRYDEQAVSDALKAVDLTLYFGTISKEELVSCIMGIADTADR